MSKWVTYFSWAAQGPAWLISTYKNGGKYVCLFICPSVGMWRAKGNPNPCTYLDEILHAHSYLSKEGFDAGLTLPPLSPLGLEGLKL